MNKQIYFCIDEYSYESRYPQTCYFVRDYERTQKYIDEGADIVTTSLAHLSYDLINKGYNIYLCYKDKKMKIEDGMQLSKSGYCLSEPSCCEDSDILDCFKSGYFDERLGIIENTSEP